jgi:hypothetical protein
MILGDTHRDGKPNDIVRKFVANSGSKLIVLDSITKSIRVVYCLISSKIADKCSGPGFLGQLVPQIQAAMATSDFCPCLTCSGER